ncbi:hypothetical protein K438DRAFT_1926744 [Mycena galopus ATCC 62051]|nr:hypothetical protein K438DRAFT_1926744 [Mycena galopus ATCC 62051]
MQSGATFDTLALETQNVVLQMLLGNWRVGLGKEKELKDLASMNRHFHSVVQPFLFRHVNVRSLEEAVELFQIFRLSCSPLAPGLHTLQIGCDLNVDAYKDSADRKLARTVWQLWKELVPAMCNLCTLTLRVDMEDMDCIHQFLRHGSPQYLPSLRTLHIAPDYDSWPQYPDHHAGSDVGPWNSSTWASNLGSPALAHVTSLIFDTPGYPFWPPTSEAADALCRSWFGKLSVTSSLAKIVLHFGYHDEAARLHIEPGDKPLDETHYTIWPIFVAESWRIPTVVWERQKDAAGIISWGRSDECRASYCDLGQHKYFQTITYSAADDLPSCVYGKELDLYENWPYSIV